MHLRRFRALLLYTTVTAYMIGSFYIMAHSIAMMSNEGIALQMYAALIGVFGSHVIYRATERKEN